MAAARMRALRHGGLRRDRRLPVVPIAEILGAAGGQASLSPPESRLFSIGVIVSDAHRSHDELAARGVAVTSPLIAESWGRYVGVEDPDGVPLYFVEQAPWGSEVRCAGAVTGRPGIQTVVPGRTLGYPKRTWAGIGERRVILANQGLTVQGPLLPGGANAGVDDVLDAAIAI
jgi:hypothetical protein